MKKYKLSEVISILEENPAAKFKNESVIGEKIEDSVGFRATVASNTIGYIDGILCWLKKDGQKLVDFRINQNNIHLWTLVQEPVSFLEAVKAYAEDKTIRCECNGIGIEKYKMKHSDSSPMESIRGEGITACEILEGTWYIED